jgi:ribonucleoside-diphosphate reductase alpha chain
MNFPTQRTLYIQDITRMHGTKMRVIKRNGGLEDVSFDKVLVRIQSIAVQLQLDRVNPFGIAKETLEGLYDKITTEELDLFAAGKCADKIQEDPQYDKLAMGILVSNLHKTTSDDFMVVSKLLHNNVDVLGENHPLLSERYMKVVEDHIELINKTIDYNRDFLLGYFGFKSLEKAYLNRVKNALVENSDDNNFKINTTNNTIPEIVVMKKNGRIVERPQHLFMRVAIGIHFEDMEKVIQCYDLLSQMYFIHASPTLYNAGCIKAQLSSCFLLHMSDSIEGIFDKTICEAANISKWSGGIGINMQAVRAKGSYIRGTNGNSDGIIPLIKVLNEIARYVNQGGRRKGAVAVYLEPWHPDVFDFCQLKKKGGAEELRARDIFIALWINDLFMKRVMEQGTWSLMCPNKCPGLNLVHGTEFEALYTKYEKEGRYVRQVSAWDLWNHIINCLLESGVPYIMFKDNINNKSNQKNIGTIQGSNLCTEIMQVSNEEETAVCNLASVCLPMFVKTRPDGSKYFDFDLLRVVIRLMTNNLNKIIDVNYYPSERAKRSNTLHRPVGMGVQGLADLYCMLDLPYDSKEADELTKTIFEHIYFAALTESCNLAKIDGPYSSFQGSPFSQGILQFHMWGLDESSLSPDLDWKGLINEIKEYGTRNSLLTTVMPTATTSQIMGNNECTEPYTYNLYKRSTMAGEYVVINSHLVEKLISLGLWNDKIMNTMIYDNGSIQYIPEIPEQIKKVFKTAFELKSKPIIDRALSIAPFIDQSHSLNLYFDTPDTRQLHSALFYSWKKGIKTGVYYLHSQPAADPIKFGLDISEIKKIEKERREYNIENKTDYPIKRFGKSQNRTTIAGVGAGATSGANKSNNNTINRSLPTAPTYDRPQCSGCI